METRITGELLELSCQFKEVIKMEAERIVHTGKLMIYIYVQKKAGLGIFETYMIQI